MTTLKTPGMRTWVYGAIAQLANSSKQSDQWFHPGDPETGSLDHVVHVLFDDIARFPQPETQVGWIFYPGQEIDCLRLLSDALERALTAHPYPKWRALKKDPQWAEVRELAGRALAAMTENDENESQE